MRCIAKSVLVVALLSKISCCNVVEAVQWVNVYPDKINIVKGSISDENVSPPTIISKGDSFVYDLPGTQSTYEKKVIFIDLFDTNKKDIASIRSMGKVVICYFSAGSLEDWRSDKSAFPKNAVGNALGEWPGEFWLDIMNDDVRTIMTARINLAKNKGCHGVDPDNVDGFDNDTGFSILKWQTKNYLQFLASQAHERSLLIGLKNSAEIATDVEQYFDFAVVEECWEYNECCQYISFGTQMKPVFAIEYRSVEQNICAKFESNGFSTNFADYDLDQIWFCQEETRHLDAVSDKESNRKLAFCSPNSPVAAPDTAPVAAPVAAPVTAPVTAPVSPPIPSNCSDDCDSTFLLDFFPVDRGCSWLTKNTKKANARKNRYCVKPEIVSAYPGDSCRQYNTRR